MKTSTSLSESLWCGSLSADRLELCVAYTGARPNTGMVLVEVELLAGWRAVSLKRLTSQVEDNMVIKHQDSNYYYQSLVD